MNIKRAKQEIKDTIEAYLLKDRYGAYEIPAIRQRPVLLIGPPGVGKTQIMEQISQECQIGLVAYTITHHTRQSAIGLPFIQEKIYNARRVSVTEYTMSEIVASIYDKIESTGLREGILFIDEIHRFNKGQQDYLLPFVEDGTIILIGATTENPYFEVNPALLSRSVIFELKKLSTEDIRLGVSQPRNKKLAEIFHRLRLIESYGTGIRRIFKLYENCPVQPSIEATTNAFRIVLPNMNATDAANEDTPATTGKSTAAITPQMKTVMDYLAEYGEMTDEDLQELLNIKKTRAYLLSRQMNENGLIDIIGRGAGKRYRLKRGQK